MYSFETEGLILKKRKAETLIEIITAMAVFGVMLGGICDFMSNQTANVAYIMKRDDMMYYANWYMNNKFTKKIESADLGLKIELKDGILSVDKGKDSMTFKLTTN